MPARGAKPTRSAPAIGSATRAPTAPCSLPVPVPVPVPDRVLPVLARELGHGRARVAGWHGLARSGQTAPMPRAEIVIVSSVGDALASLVASRAREAAARGATLSLALPGGSVATSGFPAIAAAQIDFSRLELFWGDERAVPPDHADSNYGVCARLWLASAPIPAAQVHRMPADRADLEAAAHEHEALVRARGIDVAILGVGPDGHVCSLFPGHALLDEGERWVRAITDSPKPPSSRLTLTLPALAAAKELVVVATGEAKARVVRESIEEEQSRLPLALALRAARHATVILDEPASALLCATDDDD
jgi:6-phosphogluconolactonase